MVISHNNSIWPNTNMAETVIEQVRQFRYLGTNEEWNPDQEIKSRIEVAQGSFNKMGKVHCCRQLNIKLRVRILLLLCYIWPIVLYGCEAWTTKDTRRHLGAFQMWWCRSMIRISWVHIISNEIVLQRIGIPGLFERKMKRRQVAYLGHVLRQFYNNNSWLLTYLCN